MRRGPFVQAGLVDVIRGNLTRVAERCRTATRGRPEQGDRHLLRSSVLRNGAYLCQVRGEPRRAEIWGIRRAELRGGVDQIRRHSSEVRSTGWHVGGGYPEARALRDGP